MWQIWTGDAPFKGMQMGQVRHDEITAESSVAAIYTCNDSVRGRRTPTLTFMIVIRRRAMRATQVMFSVITAGVRPEVPQDMLPAYRALMESCWQTEADARCRPHARCDVCTTTSLAIFPDGTSSIRMLLVHMRAWKTAVDCSKQADTGHGCNRSSAVRE